MKHIGPIGTFAGTSLSLVGIWLLNPWVDSFTRFQSLATLARFAPEELWGSLFLVSGTTLFVGAFFRHRKTLFVGASLALLCRLFLLVLTGIQNNWASNGVPDFVIWASMSIYCMIRSLRSES